MFYLSRKIYVIHHAEILTSNCVLEVMKCAVISAANIIRKSLNIFGKFFYMPILKFACLHWCIEVVFCSCFPYHECTQVVIFISSVSWIRVVRFHDMKSAMVFFAKPKPWKQQFQHKIIPQLNAKIRDNWDIIFIQQHPTSEISLNCPTFCLDSSFRCVLVEMFFLSSQFCWYWSNLIRNKTPLSYFNVSENRKIFWFWFILILLQEKYTSFLNLNQSTHWRLKDCMCGCIIEKAFQLSVTCITSKQDVFMSLFQESINWSFKINGK